MADVSDISFALVARIAQVLFPNIDYASGDYQPGPTGASLTLYVGWPERDYLNADLALGKVHVSVFPEARFRALQPLLQGYGVVSAPAPTLTANATANVVTFGGTGGAGQVAGLLIPNGSGNLASEGYAYRLLSTDTPATVAAQFAATIPNTSAAGAVLTLLPSTRVGANVVADVEMGREVRRQEQSFMVSIWAPDPPIRDAIASIIDAALAGSVRLSTAGGEIAMVRYGGSISNDYPEVASLWRRDLRYSVEYATTLVEMLPSMLFGGLTANGVGFGASLPAAVVFAGEDGTTLTDGSGTPIVSVQ